MAFSDNDKLTSNLIFLFFFDVIKLTLVYIIKIKDYSKLLLLNVKIFNLKISILVQTFAESVVVYIYYYITVPLIAKMNNTTLKKISEVLGLSISTISRALKDHPDISEKTKKKVVELAQTLDYEPNVNAINLRTSHSKLFGLIVPSLNNPFYFSFISAIEKLSRKNGYSLMILQSKDDPITEIANLKLFRQNRIAGLFACLSPHTLNLEPFFRLKEQEIPVIFFDKVPEDDHCNKVCVADSYAGTLAAKALVVKGHKKILGLFGNPGLLMTKKRLNAFSTVLQEQQDGTVLEIDYALNSAEAEMKTIEHLKNKPEAIFCMSDEILVGAMSAIQKSRLIVPDDIAIIGISDGFIPKLYYPAITYVETSGYKLGKLAFNSMMSSLADADFEQELISDAVLMEGGSI